MNNLFKAPNIENLNSDDYLEVHWLLKNRGDINLESFWESSGLLFGLKGEEKLEVIKLLELGRNFLLYLNKFKVLPDNGVSPIDHYFFPLIVKLCRVENKKKIDLMRLYSILSDEFKLFKVTTINLYLVHDIADRAFKKYCIETNE